MFGTYIRTKLIGRACGPALKSIYPLRDLGNRICARTPYAHSMAATWEWRRESWSFYSTVDANGQVDSRTTLIDPGSSIQRVIFRVAAHASIGLLTSDLEAELAGAGMRCAVVDETDDPEVLVYSETKMAYPFAAVLGGQVGGGNFWAAQWTVPTFNIDVRYRRSAPPPPASQLTVSCQLEYFPIPAGSVGSYITPLYLRYDADAAFLVSTPRST